MILLGFFTPRIVLMILWLFTNYLTRAYETYVWPTLGFVFLPATTLAYAIAVPELVYMSAQVWSEQVNVPEMMVVLLVCYVAMVGLINQGMQWLENRLRVPGFGQ